MRKITLISFIIILLFSLISCNKTGSHTSKDILKIEIYKPSDELLAVILESDYDEFIKELNKLVYSNHSGNIESKSEQYILITYDNYSIKVTNLLTYRIDNNNNKTRNRNRHYNEEQFNNLIDKYKILV